MGSHWTYRSCGGSLQLMRQHAGDGCAFAGLVSDPEQRIIRIVITTRAQTAFVFQRTPAAVRIFGAQTLSAGRIHRAIVHFDFRHPILGHHVQIQFLQIEMHVRVHWRILVDFDVRIFDGGRGRFDDDFLQMTINRAHEHNCVSAGARGRHCCQSGLKQCNWHSGNGLLAAQRIIDVETAKIFADRLQFGGDALHIRRNKVQSPRSMPVETRFDVLHEFSPNRFQRVHTQCRSIQGHVAFSFGKYRVQYVILRGDAQILR